MGWEEFNRLEPLGSYKMDFHFAHLCRLLMELAQAAWGGRKRRLTRIVDYMPHWFLQYERQAKREVVREPWQDIKAKMMAIYHGQKKKKGDE